MKTKYNSATRKSDEGEKIAIQENGVCVARCDMPAETELRVASEYVNATSGLYEFEPYSEIGYGREAKYVNQSLLSKYNEVPEKWWDHFRPIGYDGKIDGAVHPAMNCLSGKIDGAVHPAMNCLRHVQAFARGPWPDCAPGPGRPRWIKEMVYLLVPTISKFSHSCDANCALNFRQPEFIDGIFVFKTVKAVKSGDVLTFDFQQECCLGKQRQKLIATFGDCCPAGGQCSKCMES